MRILAFALLLALSSLRAWGQTAFTEAQIRLLDSIATQDVPEKAPGIATAIIQNGSVVYEKYAGLADLSDSTPINSRTRFNIASNGKQFTALAILTLIDNKMLALSDDIRKWFPELYPKVQDSITVRDLLNHTSGIRDCYDLWSLQGYTWWEQSFDNREVLRLIGRQADLNFRPGTAYLYSNTNYILLALLVEQVSKQSFVAYTNEMFRQLNMPNTSFEDDFGKIRGPIARAYFNFGSWTTYDWIWNVCGDGNIFSTLEDQIQWEKLVQGGGKGSFDKELIAKSQQYIEHSDFQQYGYGLEFGEYKGLAYRFHEGATGAWKATAIRFPHNNMSIVTLTNTGKSIPYQQTRQMADVALQLQPAAAYLTTRPRSVGPYVGEKEVLGTYLTENDFAFVFAEKDGKLFLSRVGRGDVELAREADNIFHQKYDPDFKLEFTADSAGRRQVTAYYVNHAPYSLTKADGPAEGFDFATWNGTYVNAETNTAISLKHLEGMRYAVTFRSDYETSGLLVSDSKLLVDFYRLEFRDGDLLLHGDRIRQVRYRRQP